MVQSIDEYMREPHSVQLQASVRYIRDNGLDKLAEAVLNNRRDGIHYGHNRDYDGLGSEEKVIALLNRGLAEMKG